MRISLIALLVAALGAGCVTSVKDKSAATPGAGATLAAVAAPSAEVLAQAGANGAARRQVLRYYLDAPLLFVKRHPYMAAHIYDDYLTWHPGGGIYVLENPADPVESHRVRAVIDATTSETLGAGVYRDPELSYDATRVLFAYKGEKDGDTCIYEIGIDGKGLKRLTTPSQDCHANGIVPQPGLIGKGQHDITPCYLPDGRIAFTSTRTGAHVMCFSSYIDTLHTMQGDGSDIRCISVNVQNEFDPAVLPDGRILYGRWEYVDKTALYMQSLWTVNPDGSNETAFYGNNLAKPTAILDSRPVPNSRLVVASLTPHNGQAVGAVAMLDPLAGKNELEALTNFTPEYPTEMDQGLRYGPSDPWPLSEDLVLMANNDQKLGKHGVLQLVGRNGFRTLVHRAPDISCYSPMLVKPQSRQARRPSFLQPGQPGMFLLHDVYQGLDGVERGDVKWLRVLETTSRISGIPTGGRWWNQAFLVSWQGSYDVKKFLGVVPVEADGSAYFEAPAGKPIYLQALDQELRLVQSQRTFVQAAEGATRSCMGCHIKNECTAPVMNGDRPLASLKPAAKLRPEAWGAGFVDYPTMIQPILDRRCVECHGGEKDIAGGIDLSGGWTWAFNISYETLLKNVLAGFLNCNNGSVRTSEILPPRTHGSGAAPLTQLLLSGHKGRIKGLTPEERTLLLAWMDGNSNYYGTWNYSETAVCKAILDAGKKLVPELKKAGCVKCHDGTIGSDWLNLQTPERSRLLRAPLAKGDAGLGLEWCRERKARKVAMPLVTQKQQPPDVFRPKPPKPAPNLAGATSTTFASVNDEAYRAMLDIIQEARLNALKTPRVDMPGAQIVKGRCRELTPIGPPALAMSKF